MKRRILVASVILATGGLLSALRHMEQKRKSESPAESTNTSVLVAEDGLPLLSTRDSSPADVSLAEADEANVVSRMSNSTETKLKPREENAGPEPKPERADVDQTAKPQQVVPASLTRIKDAGAPPVDNSEAKSQKEDDFDGVAVHLRDARKKWKAP